MNELAQDEALLQDFLTESDELVQRMEQDLLVLEGSSDPEVLNRIFRAMHTVKGTSSFLGFDALKSLTHAAEDILNALRRSELKLNSSITDLLLLCADLVKAMLNDIREHRPIDCDLTIWNAKLAAIRNSSPTEPGQALQTLVATPAETPATAPATTKEASTSSVESTTMRVDLRKLDNLVMLVGELVLERNRLSQLSRDLALGTMQHHEFDASMNESLARLSFVTDELQSASLSTRMVPIDAVLKRLPRLVRDLAATLKKDVELTIQGRETEIDRTMVELIADPLVHLIRNCLDHGLETSSDRLAAGKSAKGSIIVDAHQEGDHIVLSIVDDGRGIDQERVIRKAVEKNLISADAARNLSRREIFDLIFQPGFSTAEKVNDVSGRGVGMDVVRTNLKRLNGSVEVDSTQGQGTTVTLTVPLTMAILPVLMVDVSGELYAIPLRSVLEIVRVPRDEIKSVDGKPVLRSRDRTIPLVSLSAALGAEGDGLSKDRVRVVVLSVAEKLVGLIVDQFIGQESTVIKSMGHYLHDSRNIAGATIGGDGRVRLVLDPASLLADVALSSGVNS